MASTGSHEVRFASTHWSVVVAARRRSSPESREALATLCRAYWYPLYAFVRRQGYSAADAQDLTQGFFARLLQKQFLAAVEREKGKFRSFLLAAMKHFLANERDRARAQKRGGGAIVSLETLDFETAESRYRREPAHNVTAERIFERRWALTLLDRVLDRLVAEYAVAGKALLFEQLKDCLTAPDSARSYAELAATLAMTEGAVKVAVHRLRRRYRELLRDEIAQTVADPREVDDEIRQLFAALAAP
jgi:RNA polymerase sigma-70 factor (ECF subfamily)